ncbi:MAG TPA: VPLPA-CTERM sorting domain-containing protein [Paracoccaceae bacterium]|nr:VPLPA-CTERM sorting domain-containing protein [Paracoccaceae bacterium]
MFGKSLIMGAAFSAAMAFGASVSNAAVIDFTSASTGNSGVLAGGTTWSMTASGYLNNSQAFDGNSKPAGSGLSFETDGYGVGLDDDEITTTPMRQEWIEVAFSAPTLINAFYFLDLFQAANGSTLEIGQATVDGSTTFSLVATDIAGSGAGGFVAAIFKPIYATVIRFTILSSNDNLGYADGALAGIGIAPVPVPAAGLLLMGGLGGLAALRRRRKA